MSTFDDQARGSIALLDKRSASIERLNEVADPLLAVMNKLANNPNLDADKIERLMNVFLDGQRKMAEMQDEKLFSDAMAAFKNEPEVVCIIKDKKNKQYGNSPYVSLGHEAATITPLLSKHGLTATWSLSQGERIKIGCQLSYGLFHAAPVSIELPPDKSGSKNAAQEIKSSITYGRIITLECACGVAPVDSIASLNDDGNSIGTTPAQAESFMDESVAADLKSLIEGSGDHDELQRNYFKARDAAAAAKDVKATEVFANAKNVRLGQLNRQKAGAK